MFARRMSSLGFGWLLLGLCVSWWGIGCVKSTSTVRRNSIRAKGVLVSKIPVVLEKTVKTPLVPRKVKPPKTDVELAATLFHRFGFQTMQRGELFRQRAKYLRRVCRRKGASRRECRIYWRSQRIFARNYRTRRSNYRGYLLYSRRGRRRIPRYLKRWHHRLSQSKYEGKGGRCYLKDGLATSCMAFAMCSQRDAVRDFSGKWGKGFVFPTWGYVNYWSNRAYYSLYRDYVSKGVKRPGIRSVRKQSAGWTPEKRRRIQKTLVQDLYQKFMQIVRRKLHGASNRRLYQKMFCTNIVAGIDSFKRALPGDLFAISYIYKRSRRRRFQKMRFQHWGLVAEPSKGTILHNQTPGGLWGRKFRRWGIQYGRYKKSFFRKGWKYHRRRRQYKKRVVFLNRLNIHYFVYARKRGISIYSSRDSHLCRDWLAKYGHLYLTNFAAIKTDIPKFSPPSKTNSQMLSGGLFSRPVMTMRRLVARR